MKILSHLLFALVLIPAFLNAQKYEYLARSQQDRVLGQPDQTRIVEGVAALSTIILVANSGGPVFPVRFIYKGEVDEASRPVLVDDILFENWINGADPSSISPDDNGQFYVSTGSFDPPSQLQGMIFRMDGVWSPMYELKFGADDEGLAWTFNEPYEIIQVPFTVWDLNGTPTNPEDDIQMIALIFTAYGGEKTWGIRDSLSTWELNPAHASDWIYFANPKTNYADFRNAWFAQEGTGKIDTTVYDRLIDIQFLRRITINSLISNPLSTINGLNGLPRPAPGTVIRWTYEMPQSAVTFRVDMRDSLRTGSFSPIDGDTLLIRGFFNGWNGDDQKLLDRDGDSVYAITYDVGHEHNPGDTVDFKYVIRKADQSTVWEKDFIRGNRQFRLNPTPMTLPIAYFSTENLITFNVDMRVKDAEGVFNPGLGDNVVLRGTFNGWTGNDLVLGDLDGDGIFSITHDVGLSSTDTIKYKYVIINGEDIWEDNVNPDNNSGDRELVLNGEPQEAPLVFFNNDTPYDLVAISDLQFVTDPENDDFSQYLGDTVRVTGQVMNHPLDLFVGPRFATFIVNPAAPQEAWNGFFIIQDDSSISGTGMRVLETSMICEFNGIVEEFIGLTQLRLLTNPLVAVRILSAGNPIPEPVLLTCDDLDDITTAEKWESMRVRLENVTVVDNNLSGQNASITDATTATSHIGDYFRIFNNEIFLGNYSWPENGTKLNVNGFVRDENAGSGGIITVNPRNFPDIEILQDTLSVDLIYPNGGEVFNEDIDHRIEWQASGPIDLLQLYYSTDNGGSFTLVKDSVFNDGNFLWRIPRTPSVDCLFQVRVLDAQGASVTDESDDVFVIQDVETFVHRTGELGHTVRNDGTSGNTWLNRDQYLDEASMEFPDGSGNHYLYMHNFLLSVKTASNDTIATIFYGDNFQPRQNLSSHIGEGYTSTGTVYEDKMGLGIEVDELTIAFDDRSAVIFVYTITNNSTVNYPEVSLGIFADYDVNAAFNNLTGYDTGNSIGYQYDASGAWTGYAGMQLLARPVHAFRRLSRVWLGGQNSPQNIFHLMHDQIIDDPSGDAPEEYSLLISSAPFGIPQGGFYQEAFALVAGDGLQDLLTTAQEINQYWADDTGPILGTSTAQPATLNNDVQVNISVTDDFAVNDVYVHARQGGASNFNSYQMAYNGTDYEGQIPGTLVGLTGTEYYFKAFDLRGNEQSTDKQMLSIPVPANQLTFSVPGGTDQNAYRMISVPMEIDQPQVDAVLADDLGPQDIQNWRLFIDAQGTYTEYPNAGNFLPGRAFWLISRNSHTIDAPAGNLVQAAAGFPISLSQGWNQIAVPFNFNIAWADIMNASGNPVTSGPFEYTGGYGSPKTVLEPFKGYYVNNQTGGTISLVFPTKGAGASADKPSYGEDGWRCGITASIDKARDELNIIGVSEQSADKWDRADQLEPPPVGGYISVYFPHDDWKTYPGNYGIDIRRENEDGYIWDFAVETNIPDKRAILSFASLKDVTLPEEFSAVLVDTDLKIAQDVLATEEYGFPSSKRQSKNLRLLIGTETFISENNLGVNLVPLTFEMKQNYPNPFNPSTMITFGIPAAGEIQLDIYDLLGARVRSLEIGQREAGYHDIQWDGRNDQGVLVSSGLYIYQLRFGQQRLTRKMILLR